MTSKYTEKKFKINRMYTMGRFLHHQKESKHDKLIEVNTFYIQPLLKQLCLFEITIEFPNLEI